jgi:xanthine dehydrogenase accessory factor
MLMGFGDDIHDIAVEGSVSGGCVESAVIELARSVLGSGRAQRVEYGVSDGDAQALGLACGGRLSVLVEGREGERALAEERLIREALKRRSGAMRLVVAEGQGIGRSLVWDGSQALGSFGSAALDRRAVEVLKKNGRAGWLALDDAPKIFLRPHRSPDRLIIVGAVHIAQALAGLAPTLDFEVAVIDPRATFATPARFPEVDALVVAWPDAAALDELGLGAGASLVVLAHDPKIDDPALEAALRSGAAYVGALGSRRSHASRVERLCERGLDAADIARIRAPIGLDIGSETPEEIALSILAEIVRDRYRA